MTDKIKERLTRLQDQAHDLLELSHAFSATGNDRISKILASHSTHIHQNAAVIEIEINRRERAEYEENVRHIGKTFDAIAAKSRS